MEGLQPGFENIHPHEGGFWDGVGAGFNLIGSLLIGFICLPFFIPMVIHGFPTGGIIICTIIWWFLLGYGIHAYRRSHRRRR